jgi:multisubunit Na+/H+ antiporter MnhC subunit
MLNLAVMMLVAAFVLVACGCFVMLRPKAALVFVICGLVIFGLGVARDMAYPPQPTIVVLG